MKRFVVFLSTILISLSQAFAAVKPCEELKAEIAAKLAAKGLMGYELKISEKGEAVVAGKVVGSCEDGSRKISYVRSTPPPQAMKSLQEPPVKKTELLAATEPVTPSEEQVPVVAVQMIQVEPKPTAAIKSCEQLQTEIAAKLDSKGLKGGYELTVSAHDGAEGKVVGTCENGSKKIIYLKK